ncbi:MAG: class I SAM-dependent methyltransferase [bacterium]
MYDYAQLYDDAHRQVVEDLSLYRRIAGNRPRRILELACGTGRVACALAADGHTVIGIDSSTDMLAEARRRASAVAGECTFLAADMRSFEIPGDFDLILLPLNGCAHLHSMSDLSDMFRHAADHLRHNGRFVCHLFRYGSGLAPGSGALSSRGSFESRMLGGEVEWYESRTFSPGGEFEYLKWYFVPDTPRDSMQRSPQGPPESQDADPADTVETELTLRIYSPGELSHAASRAGLALAGEYTPADLGDATGPGGAVSTTNPAHGGYSRAHTAEPDWFGVFSHAPF